jgi:putative membrane protein
MPAEACGLTVSMQTLELRDMQRFLSNLLIPFLTILPTGALAQQAPYGGHMWDSGWHGWFLGPIMMIVFIAVAVVVVMLLVRWLGGGGSAGPLQPPHGKTALDILKERYARGEIDTEEYEERRRALQD